MATVEVRTFTLVGRLGRLAMAASLMAVSTAFADTAIAADPVNSQQQRATLGLPADEASIRAIAASGKDVGSEKWGFVASAEEVAAVENRMRRAQAVEDRVAPLLDRLTTFGGMEYQANGTRLVVYLTEPATGATERAATNLMPEGTTLEFRLVDETYAELKVATEAVFDVWPSVTPLPLPYHASLETSANLVRIGVDPAHLDEAVKLRPALERALKVTIDFEIGEPAVAHACSSRDNCTSPIKSAVRVRKGSPTSPSVCTMGFQVSKNGDEQFITAGHCANSGSNDWYHQGYGSTRIGYEHQNLYSSGYDAVRIGIPDAQATHWMYADGFVVGWVWPRVGDVVIQNQAMTGNVVFTEVTDDWHCWTHGTQSLCGSRMAGVTGQGGDSGAPLYRAFSGQLYAVGINFGGCGGGCMTRVGDILSRMGVTLVVGGP